MKRMIAVIGKGDALQGSPDYEIAEKIGFTLIESGYRLVTGGLKGVMEAASRGAHNASKHEDGDVVGILPGIDRSEANPYLDIVIPTGIGVRPELCGGRFRCCHYHRRRSGDTLRGGTGLADETASSGLARCRLRMEFPPG